MECYAISAKYISGNVGCTAMTRGDAEHRRWERSRANENECVAEKRLADLAKSYGADMRKWWDQWFERSDDWREEIGFTAENGW